MWETNCKGKFPKCGTQNEVLCLLIWMTEPIFALLQCGMCLKNRSRRVLNQVSIKHLLGVRKFWKERNKAKPFVSQSCSNLNESHHHVGRCNRITWVKPPIVPLCCCTPPFWFRCKSEGRGIVSVVKEKNVKIWVQKQNENYEWLDTVHNSVPIICFKEPFKQCRQFTNAATQKLCHSFQVTFYAFSWNCVSSTCPQQLQRSKSLPSGTSHESLDNVLKKHLNTASNSKHLKQSLRYHIIITFKPKRGLIFPPSVAFAVKRVVCYCLRHNHLSVDKHYLLFTLHVFLLCYAVRCHSFPT